MSGALNAEQIDGGGQTESDPLSRSRFWVGYVLLVLVPLLGVGAVLQAGSALQAPLAAATATPSVAAPLQTTLRLAVLLAQIVVIIIASRLLGNALRRVRQPQVVGEMLAGILLGPSLLGWAAPAVYAMVFPAGTLRFLNALSQIGLLLFMFLVGLELDPKLLRGRGRVALLTSHASITAPMFLGTALALVLYTRVSSSSVAFMPFSLFLGAAMSVTAFPVLARILTERRLQHTRLGAVAIACAAVDDVTAWCVLAIVVAIARAGDSAVPLWVTMGGAGAFAAFMLGVVRPTLGIISRKRGWETAPTQNVIAIVVVLVLASAWVTERLGVHALFGAFLAGVTMPKHEAFVKGFMQRFEDILVVLLLPLFFAYTGLRMNVGMLSGAGLWLLCFAIIATAIAGKFGGSAVAGRVSGLSWREASTIGALMNTRGLMELVILNIGLDLGVITPVLFTMMVLMALTTTFMTTPLVEWLQVPASRQAAAGLP